MILADPELTSTVRARIADEPDYFAKVNQSVPVEGRMAIDDFEFFKGQRIYTAADGRLDILLG
jgi:hypothetical protein